MAAFNSVARNCVAIGGVGGSGTRLVAEIVKRFGFHLGGSLNHANDNLWFTLLFQRPRWFAQFPSDQEIARAIRLFRKAMVKGLSDNISENEKRYIWNIIDDSKNNPTYDVVNRARAESLIASKIPNKKNFIGICWKEPNTHIFLPYIAEEMENLKYIHVIRDGRDIAFAKYHRQLHNWGSFMGVSVKSNSDISSKSLDYWIAANRRAIDIGKTSLNSNFYLLKYEQLCARPQVTIRKLARFLNIELNLDELAKLKKIVAPRSIGRHRDFPTGLISEAQLRAIRDFGFDTGDL